MKKIIGAVMCVVVLSGCGGPLEDEGTAPAVGSAQQQVVTPRDLVPVNRAPQLNTNLVRAGLPDGIRLLQFQEQQGISDPVHRPPCP